MITSTTYNVSPESNFQIHAKSDESILVKNIKLEKTKNFFSMHKRTILKVTLATTAVLITLGVLYLHLSQKEDLHLSQKEVSKKKDLLPSLPSLPSESDDGWVKCGCDYIEYFIGNKNNEKGLVKVIDK